MPKDKDLKRLTRTRMQKTGESYTTARAQLLAKKERAAAAQAASAPHPGTAPPDYAALAGMSDETVAAKTGCSWQRWVEALDYKGAASMSHKEIAEYVRETFGISGWWAQTVTVGYERIKGLREIGQRRGGGYEANKSRTFPVPLARLYRACRDKRLRERWLPGVELTVRKATPERSMRITWPDETSVELWFVPKGDAESPVSKSQIQVQHRKLASRQEAEERKAYWGERLAALGELLAGA